MLLVHKNIAIFKVTWDFLGHAVALEELDWLNRNQK